MLGQIPLPSFNPWLCNRRIHNRKTKQNPKLSNLWTTTFHWNEFCAKHILKPRCKHILHDIQRTTSTDPKQKKISNLRTTFHWNGWVCITHSSPHPHRERERERERERAWRSKTRTNNSHRQPRNTQRRGNPKMHWRRTKTQQNTKHTLSTLLHRRHFTSTLISSSSSSHSPFPISFFYEESKENQGKKCHQIQKIHTQ